MTTATETMSTADAAASMGVTPRVLDYWSRTGVLAADTEAAGSGSRRRWSLETVRVGRALAHLNALGATSDALAMAAGQLERRLRDGEWAGRVTIDVDGVVLDRPVPAAFSLDLALI